MICADEFVFKSLESRAGGVFKNDKGDTIEYDEVYILKVDEKTREGKINERKFKFGIQNQALAAKLREFEAYEHIKLYFEVTIYANGVKLNPYDVELVG